MQAYYEAENRHFENDIVNPKQIHLLRPQIEKNRSAIRECAKGLTGTLVIVGMGRGVFLPLEALSEQFDRVVAIDIDRSSMQRAVQMLPERLQQKIALVTDDVTGAVASFSTTVERLLTTCDTADRFVQRLLQQINRCNPVPLDLAKYRASFAISSMTMSHLLDTPFRYLQDRFCQRYGVTSDILCNNYELMKAISQLNAKIQRTHLLQLDDSVIKAGRVFISSAVAMTYTTFTLDHKVVESDAPVSLVEPEVKERLDSNSVRWVWEKSLPLQQEAKLSVTYGTRVIVQAQIRTKF